MADLIALVTLAIFLSVSLLYIAACDRLKRSRP
jgi:hypothetical protein